MCFTEELRLLTLRVIIEWCIGIHVTWFAIFFIMVCCFVLSSSLILWGLFILCVLLGIIKLFTQMFFFWYLLLHWIGGQNLLKFVLTMKYFSFSLIMIDSFDGYSSSSSSLCYSLWPFRACRISFQALMAFGILTEKSGFIQIGLSLYMTKCFFPSQLLTTVLSSLQLVFEFLS